MAIITMIISQMMLKLSLPDKPKQDTLKTCKKTFSFLILIYKPLKITLIFI